MVDTEAASKLASSAAVLIGRKIAVSAMSAAASVVVVRSLLPEQFGQYAAGMAAYFVLLALTDFGFGEVLGRTLGRRGGTAQRFSRLVLRLHLTWSATVALGGLAFALLVGAGTVRGGVLLALVPAIAVAGASSLRQVFYARHAVGRLATLDLVTTAASTIALIALAATHAQPFVLALAIALGAVANSLLVIRAAWPLISPTAVDDGDAAARSVVTQAAPIGLASFLATAYVSIDVVLLSSLLPADSIGRYAAAAKVLTILTMLPGVVMGMALPQISSELRERAGLTALLARVANWFASLVLPAFVLTGLHAPIVMGLLFGVDYTAAAPLLRILMVAGIVQLVSQLLGVVAVAAARSTWLIGQNVLALVINVGGNLWLAPRFGIGAAAWLTVVTELTVCLGSCWALRHRFDAVPLLRACTAPVAALAPVMVLGVLLTDRPWVSIPLCCLTYLITLTALRGWPIELTLALQRWRKFA